MDPLNQRIFSKVKAIIDKIIFSNKKTYFEFEGEKLFFSEIHLLLHIGQDEKQSKNATKIAKALGITKGAVSQNLSRLKRKGIIIKMNDAYKKNELNLFFTPKGKKVLQGCLETQSRSQKVHDSLLEDFSQEHKKIIFEFLKRLEGIL